MAREQNQINLPGGFGGLMRYGEEYDSNILLKPTHVVGLVILIIAFRMVLPLIF